MVSRVVFLVCVTVTACNAFFLPANYNKVNIRFIYGPNSNFRNYNTDNVTQILNHESFDRNKPTVMYVFGWTRAPNEVTTLLITNAYLKRGDYNILLLDWSDYSVGVYHTVMARICKISRIYGRVLLKLFDKGLNAKSFHCVGHSFGAHSCGIMGRELYRSSNKRHKFGRISGLDPAGPGFFPTAVVEQPLNRGDGEFVDSIHSDVFFIGTKSSTGHTNFYTNYGMVQPNCPPMSFATFYDFLNSMCSHENAVYYWAQTLHQNNEKYFPSYKCKNWDGYVRGKCTNNSVNYMGIKADANLQGSYFINLDSKYSFDGRASFFWLLKRIEQRAVQLLSLDL